MKVAWMAVGLMSMVSLPAQAGIVEEIRAAEAPCNAQKWASITPFVQCLNEANRRVWRRNGMDQAQLNILEVEHDRKIELSTYIDAGKITAEVFRVQWDKSEEATAAALKDRTNGLRAQLKREESKRMWGALADALKRPPVVETTCTTNLGITNCTTR